MLGAFDGEYNFPEVCRHVQAHKHEVSIDMLMQGLQQVIACSRVQ